MGEDAKVSTVKAGLFAPAWEVSMFLRVERELCDESCGEPRSWGDRRGGAVAKVMVCVERFAFACA